MTPQTVPSNPRNGAPLTAIASRIRPDSSFNDSWATMFSSVRLTCSMLLSETYRFRGPFRVFQSRVQFDATSLINHEQRATFGLNTSVEDIQDRFLGAEFGREVLVELLGAAHLDGFGNHHRPRENREDDAGSR